MSSRGGRGDRLETALAISGGTALNGGAAAMQVDHKGATTPQVIHVAFAPSSYMVDKLYTDFDLVVITMMARYQFTDA